MYVYILYVAKIILVFCSLTCILCYTVYYTGVCPMPIADLVPSLPSPNLVPHSQQMSREMFHTLTLFFQPFNDLLASHTGINTTLWNTKTPPSKLPKYSAINKTLSELWFIKKETIKTLHLLPQLLPQRYSFFLFSTIIIFYN